MYCVGYSDQAQFGTIVVTPTDCTVSFQTPKEEMLTSALGNPCRMLITVTGASPKVLITLQTLLPEPKRRFLALLGCRYVSGLITSWSITDGSATQIGAFGLFAGQTPENPAYSAAYAGNLAQSGFALVPIGASVGQSAIVDVGRFWSSNYAQIPGAPWSQWTDNDDANVIEAESIGHNLESQLQSARSVIGVPWDATEQYLYFDEPNTTTEAGRASIREMLRQSSGGHIVAGYFRTPSFGNYRAADLFSFSPFDPGERNGGRLIYGRITDRQPIQRVSGQYFRSQFTIREAK